MSYPAGLQKVNFFVKTLIICMYPIITLGANVNATNGSPIGMPSNPSFDSMQAEKNNIYLKSSLSKSSYKYKEQLALEISIWNRTSYDLVFLDTVEEYDFEFLIRENRRGILPLNEHGLLKKRNAGTAFGRSRTLLKHGEVKNYEVVLSSIFDIDVGNYEIIVKRQLYLPVQRSLIDKLFHLNKSPVIDLISKPIRFEMVK